MTTLARGPGSSNLSLFSNRENPQHPSATFSAEDSLQELRQSIEAETSLRSSLDERFHQELGSLAREVNPQAFTESLFSLAQRSENEDKTELALCLYAHVQQHLQSFPSAASPGTQRHLQERLDAIQGQGNALPRSEYLLRRLVKQAADPAMIVAMGAASGIFAAVRMGALARLTSAPVANILNRGVGARVLANLAGFAAEAPAFTAAARGMNALLGREQNWSSSAVWQVFASGAVTLFGLKLAGGASGALVQRLNRGLAAFQISTTRALISEAIPQVGTFFGIWGSHALEQGLGLRPHVDGATTLVDVLSTQLNLLVGGRLMHQAMGSGFQARQSAVEQRAEWLGQANVVQSSEGNRISATLRRAFLVPMWWMMGAGGIGGSVDIPTGGNRPPRGYTPRPFQTPIIGGVGRDARNHVSPWLGAALPMQTGKSWMAGPFIQELRQSYPSNTRFLILSSGEVITDQVMGDLQAGFPATEVGRFDRNAKEIRPITVASVRSLIHHLEDFNQEGPTVLINDEAYFTQSPSYRRVYQHFGLGEVVQENGRSVMRPKAGNGLVIGLSGTGSGLAGHHISGQFQLLDAIESGWVRHMRGERVMMEIPSEQREDANGERMVWWQATESNARVLTEIYRQHIHGRYLKNLVFVPTIEHATLLQSAMQREFGPNQAFVAHSRMGDAEFDAAMAGWQSHDGALISVKKLSRGFRGTGTESVFHTYQTESTELFSQRTGRAWGQPTHDELGELYVLEATWQNRPSLANLARLLGLAEYPRRDFTTQGIRARNEAITRRRTLEGEVQAQIQIGRVTPTLSKTPISETWLRGFSEAAKNAGGINELSRQTSLPMNLLLGWSMGALPLRFQEVSRLGEALGGENHAAELWIRSWDQGIEENLSGIQAMEPPLAEALSDWRKTEGSPLKRADALHWLLLQHFPTEDPVAPIPKSGIPLLVHELKESRESYKIDLPEEASLFPYVQEQAQRFHEDLSDPRMKEIFRSRFLTEPALTFRAIAELTGTSAEKARHDTLGLRDSFLIRIIRELSPRTSTVAPIPIVPEVDQSTLPLLGRKINVDDFSCRTQSRLDDLGIQTYGDLVGLSVSQLKGRNFGKKSLREVQDELARKGLSLASNVPGSSSRDEAILSQLNQKFKFEELRLSRAIDRLQGLSIQFYGDLARLTDKDLITKNFGTKSLREIKDHLKSVGLRLGMRVQWARPTDKISLESLQFTLRTAQAIFQLAPATLNDLTEHRREEIVSRFGEAVASEIGAALLEHGLNWAP